MRSVLVNVCFILNFSYPALAQMRSEHALRTQWKGQNYVASLDAGFHFNDKAPNGIQDGDKLITPSSLAPTLLSFESLPKNLKGASVHLYVCDDAVTFCEVHAFALNKKGAAKVEKTVKTQAPQRNEEGFLLNDLGFAITQAKKNNSIILVDFGARWCPSCLRLDDDVFKSKEFQVATADIVKLKIDVDLFTNATLLEKYGVHGFPTLIFLTKAGEEILRITDYQPSEKIQSVLNEAKKNPVSLRELETAAKSNKDFKEAQASILWTRYFQSEQYDKAFALMDAWGARPPEYLDAKVERALELAKKDHARRDHSCEEIRATLQAEGGTTRSLRWRSEFMELLSDKKEEAIRVAKESDTLTDHLLSDPDILKKALENDSVGEFTGFERFYITFTNAETAEAAEANAEQAWGKAYTEGVKAKISADQHGPSLRLLTAAMQSHQPKEALKIVNGLLERHPADGDLQRRKLRTLLELKEYPEAVSIGEKALQNSYGTNEFFVVEPLVKAYLGEEQKAKAHDLVAKYLARNEMQFETMKHSKKTLEDLLKKTL